MTNTALMNCKSCNSLIARRSARQLYCLQCSEDQHNTRRGEHGPSRLTSNSLPIKRGLEISKDAVRTAIIAHNPLTIDSGWMVSFKMPFTQAASKNHVWSLGKGGGHVFKRSQSRAFQDAVAYGIKSATRGIRIYQNKIWIEIFVQKPHHKGDAINVLDVICDGLKVGLGIDDRWFCVRQIDWEIAKNNPQIFITVCQTLEYDAQPCSHCGRIFPLTEFRKKKTAKLGVDRVCCDCRGVSRKDAAA